MSIQITADSYNFYGIQYTGSYIISSVYYIVSSTIQYIFGQHSTSDFTSTVLAYGTLSNINQHFSMFQYTASTTIPLQEDLVAISGIFEVFLFDLTAIDTTIILAAGYQPSQFAIFDFWGSRSTQFYLILSFENTDCFGTLTVSGSGSYINLQHYQQIGINSVIAAIFAQGTLNFYYISNDNTINTYGNSYGISYTRVQGYIMTSDMTVACTSFDAGLYPPSPYTITPHFADLPTIATIPSGIFTVSLGSSSLSINYIGDHDIAFLTTQSTAMTVQDTDWCGIIPF